MKSLIIRRENVDWIKILNLALNKKDWGKKYVIYSCKTTTIEGSMYEFNFEENNAIFKIKTNYVYNQKTEQYTSFICFYLNHSTINQFETLLKKKINNSLKDIKRNVARKIHNELYFPLYQIKKEEIIKCGFEKEYLQIEKMNDNIKKEFIDVLKDKTFDILNKPYYDKIKSSLDNNEIKIKGVDEIITDLNIN